MKISLMKIFSIFRVISACTSPYEWYNIKSDSGLIFEQCESLTNGTTCEVTCSNGTPSIDSIRCHCLDENRCKWLPRKRFTTVKCHVNSHDHVIMARRGPIGARPRPKGLSRKSRLRLTAQDVVFTKRTAKQSG